MITKTIITNYIVCCIVFLNCDAAFCSTTFLRYYRDGEGNRQVERVEALWSARNGFHAYDNWSDSTLGGRTTLTTRLSVGTNEVGDDLQLRPISNAIVSDIGWTFWNASTTNIITHFEADIRFYDESRQLVGMDPFEIDLGLQPNGAAVISSSGYFYAGYHIPASQQMYMSIQFTHIIGAGPGDMGMLIGGPITLGNSSQNLYNFSTNQQIDLGASPQRNLGFFMDVVPAPTPGSLTALVAMSPFALKRRRN